MAEQHDAHCLLTVQTRAWRIFAMKPGFVFLRHADERCVLDLRFVLWETHEEAATWMLHLHAAAIAGRLATVSGRPQ